MEKEPSAIDRTSQTGDEEIWETADATATAGQAETLVNVPLHEAAHCFRAWERGRVLFKTYAKPDKPGPDCKSWGRCEYGRNRGDRDSAQHTVEEIVIFLAAPQAEKEMLGAYAGGRGDALRVMNGILEFDRYTPLRRLRTAARAAVSAGGKNERAEAFLEEAELHLPRLDRKAKRAIRALARELEKKGELYGNDCAAILESAYGEKPEKALPIPMHNTGPRPETPRVKLVDALEKVMQAETAIRDQSRDDSAWIDVLEPLINVKLRLIARLKNTRPEQ